jgi:hypothetical protein
MSSAASKSGRKLQQTPYKLHIHRWVNGVSASYASVTMAQELVVTAPRFHELISWARDGRFDLVLTAVPDPQLWESFYSDHERLTVAVCNTFPDLVGAEGHAVQQSLDEARAISVEARRPDTTIGRDLIADAGGVPRLLRMLNIELRKLDREYKRHLRRMRAIARGHDPHHPKAVGADATEHTRTNLVVSFIR